uniref:Reverse transcriptase domain-containing protein n=1 Tax=Trichogramma kaykai TaxID=54128 RepID=A0ABD2W8E4_9HYME
MSKNLRISVPMNDSNNVFSCTFYNRNWATNLLQKEIASELPLEATSPRLKQGRTWLESSTKLTFFEKVKITYGVHVQKCLKDWQGLRYDLAMTNARMWFLKSCRLHKLVPQTLINQLNRPVYFYSNLCRDHSRRTMNALNKKFLNLMIDDIHIKRGELYRRLNSLRGRIDKFGLLTETLNNFYDSTNQKCDVIFNKALTSLKEKFTKLRTNRRNTSQATTKQDWLINLTNTPMPKEFVDIVSLGPKFKLPTNWRKSNVVDTIKNVESCISQLRLEETDVQNDIRNIVVNNLKSSTKNMMNVSKSDQLLNDKLQQTRDFLKDNKHLFFTKADKGNVTVCMEVDEYNNKMSLLLNDEKTYEKVKRNPLSKLRLNTATLLKEINNECEKKLNRFQLSLSDTSLARAYGLPKIHKTGVPLRPIISLVGSPTYVLAKIFLDEIIPFIKQPNSHIDNSFDFMKKISNFSIPTDYVLISLDVTSLFTNIPLDRVLDSLDRRYLQLSRSKITFEKIREITKFLFENTYFKFNNVYYRQIFGTPMGSLISPMFADLVMEDLEMACLGKLKQRDCSPLFYFRYVDDTILCVKKSDIGTVVEVFNNYDERLQFTHEVEQDKKLNFLDLTLINANNKLHTDWYQKTSNSTRLLSYNSRHSMQQKINIVYNLTDRAILLSDQRYHSKNIEKIRKLLLENDYPISFINRHLFKRLWTIKNRRNTTVVPKISKKDEIRRVILKLPFIDKFFEKCAHMLRRFNIEVLPLQGDSLTSVIRLGKDRIDINDRTGVVYHLKCKSCSKSYVGETKRKLKDRIREHKKLGNTQSMVALHMQEQQGHVMDWSKVKILDLEDNYHRRLISEMIHINNTQDTLNRKEDIKDLNKIYVNILKHVNLTE